MGTDILQTSADLAKTFCKAPSPMPTSPGCCQAELGGQRHHAGRSSPNTIQSQHPPCCFLGHFLCAESSDKVHVGWTGVERTHDRANIKLLLGETSWAGGAKRCALRFFNLCFSHSSLSVLRRPHQCHLKGSFSKLSTRRKAKVGSLPAAAGSQCPAAGTWQGEAYRTCCLQCCALPPTANSFCG